MCSYINSIASVGSGRFESFEINVQSRQSFVMFKSAQIVVVSCDQMKLLILFQELEKFSRIVISGTMHVMVKHIRCGTSKPFNIVAITVYFGQGASYSLAIVVGPLTGTSLDLLLLLLVSSHMAEDAHFVAYFHLSIETNRSNNGQRCHAQCQHNHTSAHKDCAQNREHYQLATEYCPTDCATLHCVERLVTILAPQNTEL